MSTPLLAVPKGSWILVTGATGFLASHITKQLLDRGYKVRGTVRDLAAASWVTDEMFPDATRRGDLELTTLDIASTTESAFDAAVKGVQGIIHPATILTFDPNPNNVIPPTVSAVANILKAAAREPTVKRFIYTSSAVASFMPNPSSSEIISVGRDSWNDASVVIAREAQPPYDNPLNGPIIYAASKVEAEKFVWKFAAEEKPQFDISVVSPYTLIGPVLHKSYANKSVPSWIKDLYHGKTDVIKNFGARKCTAISRQKVRELIYVIHFSLLRKCQRCGATARRIADRPRC